ncbi:hypothetical protein [Kitasatospora sp. MAP5-34]|uniref:hypothetical protein n=1 Tax=Kitasatospora sp. MAP5-34 TaxID=3035102 RepID=UPI00247379B8|nr:hypothetical protein [Kitasatospora sp. MAP5-34]
MLEINGSARDLPEGPELRFVLESPTCLLPEAELGDLADHWRVALDRLTRHAGDGGHTPSEFWLISLGQEDIDEFESAFDCPFALVTGRYVLPCGAPARWWSAGMAVECGGGGDRVPGAPLSAMHPEHGQVDLTVDDSYRPLRITGRVLRSARTRRPFVRRRAGSNSQAGPLSEQNFDQQCLFMRVLADYLSRMSICA